MGFSQSPSTARMPLWVVGPQLVQTPGDRVALYEFERVHKLKRLLICMWIPRNSASVSLPGWAGQPGLLWESDKQGEESLHQPGGLPGPWLQVGGRHTWASDMTNRPQQASAASPLPHC
jgi:hypothetical protein